MYLTLDNDWNGMDKYVFLLGGRDAEMVRIKQILTEEARPFHDANLGWGAKASAYQDLLANLAESNEIPVLVELEIDVTLPQEHVIIDHHGQAAGNDASVLQVLKLINRQPTRWDELIGAMDAGYFQGLAAIQATPEEIAQVCAAERNAAGVTPAEEVEAEQAIAAPPEWWGTVRVLHAAHSKMSPIGDRLTLEAISRGKKALNYVIFSGTEVNFSGDGELAERLHRQFGGWAGGQGLGEKGGIAYWGGHPNFTQVKESILNWAK